MSEPQQLLRKYCRDGDHGAFRAFYRAQATRLWRFLVARGCDPDSAYDLLSEAFLRFIQSICKDPSSPVALLYRIAINLHIDSYRRAQTAAIDPSIDPDGVVTQTDAETDERAYVRDLMGELDASEQNLLLLRYWIGLTHKEIAGMLEVPEGTVRRECAAALNRLRDMWGQE